MRQKLVFIISLFIVSLIFWNCKGKMLTSTTTIEYDEINEEYQPEDSKLSELIAPYDQKLSAEMNEVIGSLNQGMEKKRPEGLLSNLIADLVLSEVQKLDGFSADICLLNHGGLRAPLPEGDVKVKDIFQLMPFENEVVVLELTGDKIQEIANYLNYSGGEPISGATVILGEKPEIRFNYKELENEKTYMVVTTDYLAKGGDKMNFFLNPVNYQKTGIKLRDMILTYFKNMKASGQVIDTNLDGRISTK